MTNNLVEVLAPHLPGVGCSGAVHPVVILTRQPRVQVLGHGAVLRRRLVSLVDTSQELLNEVQRQQRLAEHQHLDKVGLKGLKECINTIHLVTDHGALFEDVHEQDHLVAKADVIQLISLRHHVPPPTLAGAAACVIRGRPCDGFLHHSVPIDINLLVNKNNM